MHVDKDFKPHPSHEMGPWRSSIVTLVATARFGEIRVCRGCEAEEAKSGSGHAAHEELALPCERAV
jgi:hypothetical protein